MHTQRIVITSMLLVLFGSTIFQSCRFVGTSALIYDMRFDAISFGTTVATQNQNVTYEGDIFVSNDETFTIQDSEFYMIGKITVQDTSTLIIGNSKFTAIPIYTISLNGESIVLEDQAKLIITNTTLISKHPSNFDCKILVHNDAEVNITHSTSEKLWKIVAYDNSAIHVNNSTIIAGSGYYDGSGVASFDTSTATIENSTIDGVFVWGNSLVSVKNSVIGLARTGGETAVNILDSEIKAITTFGSIGEVCAPTFIVQDSTVTWRANFLSSSSARFTSSSVAELIARGNANILLIDSHAGSIETRDDATVLVGWHFPLFGLVTMHYTWVPIIQTIITITIIVIIIAVLVFLLRKRAKQGQREPTSASEVKKIYRTIICP